MNPRTNENSFGAGEDQERPSPAPVLPSRGLAPRHFALAVLASVPFFLTLSTLQITGSEGRWLEISRGMRESGDWLEPQIQGEFYGDKPLLSYWAIAIASVAFGGLDEAVARIPSAVSGLVSVLLTLYLASRWFAPRVAVLSSCVLATSFSFLVWSRTAAADTMNVAFTTAAVCVYASAVLRFRPWKPSLFFILLALGAQAKGMPALILPLAVAGVDVVLSRRRDLLRSLPSIALGTIPGLVLFFAPFVLSYALRHDWQLLYLVYKENFVRALDAFDHVAPVYYYFYVLPAMMLPWGAWLPAAVAWAAARVRSDLPLRFILVSFAVMFALFTASESRRSYYILPLFPFASILIARFLLDAAQAWEDGRLGRAWRVLLAAPLWVLASALVLAVLFLAVGRWIPWGVRDMVREMPLVLPFAAVLVALSALWVLAWRRGCRKGLILAAALTALTVMTYHPLGFEPLRAGMLTERPFGAWVRAECAKELESGALVYYRGVNLRLRYYIGRGTEALDAEELKAILEARGSPLLVIAREKEAGELRSGTHFVAEEIHAATRLRIGEWFPPRTDFYAFRVAAR